MSKTSPSKSRKSWLKGLLLGVVVLFGSALLVVSFFSVPLAQWTLRSLRARGLTARVDTADFFRGRLKVRRLSLTQRSRIQSFRINARRANLRLNLWRLLFGRFREVSTLELKAPSITILRKEGQTIQSSRHSRQKKWKKLQQNLRGIGGKLLRIVHLRIIRGDLTFEDRSRPSQTVKVHCKRVDTTLRHWHGRLALSQLKVTLKNAVQSVKLAIPKTSLRFNFHDFLRSPVPVVRELTLHSPVVSIRRLVAPTPRKKRRPFTSSITLRKLVLANASVSLVQGAPGKPRMSMRIQRVSGEFEDYVGTLRMKGLRMTKKRGHQSVDCRIAAGLVRLDLRTLFHSKLPLHKLSLTRPRVTLSVRGKPRSEAPPKKWLTLQDTAIKEGALTLHSVQKKHDRDRQIRMKLSNINANIRGLDLQQLFAKPFSGKGSLKLQGHGPLRFVVKMMDQRRSQWSLPNFPLQALLAIRSGRTPPFRFESGHAALVVDFYRTRKRLSVRSSLSLHDVSMRVTLQRRGLRRFALRGVTRLLNKRVFGLPGGYKVKADFVMQDPGVLENPKRMMQRMAQQWSLALLNALAKKHRLIALLRSRIRARLTGAAPDARNQRRVRRLRRLRATILRLRKRRRAALQKRKARAMHRRRNRQQRRRKFFKRLKQRRAKRIDAFKKRVRARWIRFRKRFRKK